MATTATTTKPMKSKRAPVFIPPMNMIRANRCTATIQHHKDGEKIGTYFSYDLMGNKISSTDRYGHTTSYEYDHANRLSKLTFPNKTTSQKEYDIFDNLDQGNKPKWQLPPTNIPSVKSQALLPMQMVPTNALSYNKEGTLAHEWDQSGTKTSYTYDVLGQDSRNFRL